MNERNLIGNRPKTNPPVNRRKNIVIFKKGRLKVHQDHQTNGFDLIRKK